MHLKNNKRKSIAEQIKETLSYGDITNNTEYEDAKNEQAFVEGRIITLEKLLSRARLLEIDNNNWHLVALLAPRISSNLKDLQGSISVVS